jgi:cytochrome c553
MKRIQPTILAAGLALAAAAALGCGKGESIPPEAMAEAQLKFDTLCSTCHGKSGTGDGPNAVNLNPKPRNYTDTAWQAQVDDDYLAEVIVNGGASKGLSPLMTPNPDLKDKPDVVKGLVKIIRNFGK